MQIDILCHADRLANDRLRGDVDGLRHERAVFDEQEIVGSGEPEHADIVERDRLEQDVVARVERHEMDAGPLALDLETDEVPAIGKKHRPENAAPFEHRDGSAAAGGDAIEARGPREEDDIITVPRAAKGWPVGDRSDLFA